MFFMVYPCCHGNGFPECILVGSFSGILRGYRPSPGGYKPDHLLIEKQLDAPIVQLAVEHIVE